MIKDTSLCMGCMNDKTYDGPCRLCGYSDDMPCIPTYMAPRTFLADRYIVGKVISYNGEGAVYIGFDTATGTKVTIKEFMPDTLCSRKKGETDITVNPDSAALYKTYLSEFVDLNRTLMKSRGMTHLQTVLDVFSENNTAYAVFEFINGISLKTYLANSAGEMTWEQIKELFPPFFTTLSLIHSAGVLHRGISPSTIFVTDKLELKLTGFSISAARTTGTEIACEVFSGYAAPEQYTSNALNGTWTDVYGISAVLYRCLTGCTPTEAIARTGGSLLEPMMINRNVPPNVSAVIMSGLKLNTDNRIRTITEFVDKLFRQPKPLENTEKRPITKKERRQRRERVKTIMALSVAGLIVIAFIVALKLPWNDILNNGEPPVSSEFDYGPSDNNDSSGASSQPESSVPPVTLPFTEEASQPEANIVLPDFTNRIFDSEKLRHSGRFTFVPTYVYNKDFARGFIFEQDIPPQTMVTAGTEIAVKVSMGPSEVALPKYEDMPIDEYIKELTALNIKYKTRQKKTNDAEDGCVFMCQRENKLEIFAGDLVNVENSETITVFIAKNYTEEVSAPEDDNSRSDSGSSAPVRDIPVED